MTFQDEKSMYSIIQYDTKCANFIKFHIIEIEFSSRGKIFDPGKLPCPSLVLGFLLKFKILAYCVFKTVVWIGV